MIGIKTIKLQLVDNLAINLQLIGKVKINLQLIGSSNARHLYLCPRHFRSRNDGLLLRKVAFSDLSVADSFRKNLLPINLKMQLIPTSFNKICIIRGVEKQSEVHNTAFLRNLIHYTDKFQLIAINLLASNQLTVP